MKLQVITPLETFHIEEVERIYAEGLEGYFTLLPRHADYVASIMTSIFSFQKNGERQFFAVDGGILVKCGEEVSFSVRNAFKGNDLDDVKEKMEKAFHQIEEDDKKTKTVLASLEGNIAKLILDLGQK